ncbi:MAG: lipocalin family protein [Bacteroidales bacterium]|nr:lipocalin family protein [Bacteroidales bacterium]
MKKLYVMIIAVVIMGLCFSSCNKPEKLIIGKWKVEEQKLDGAKVKTAEGETWSFTDDNKFKGHIDGTDYSGKYTCDGDELILSGGDFTDKNIDQIVFTIDAISKTNMSLSGKVKLAQAANQNTNQNINQNTNNGDDWDDWDKTLVSKVLANESKITVELKKK